MRTCADCGKSILRHAKDCPRTTRGPAEVEPKLEYEDNVSGKAYSHPSYGAIHVGRLSGGNPNLFGSNLTHHHYVSISIGRALEMVGDTGDQRSFSAVRGELIEIHLSELQWSRLLSSAGNGEGVQCTIRYVDGVEQPPCPEVDVAERFHEAVASTANDATRELKMLLVRLRDRLELPKPLNKTEGNELLDRLRQAIATINDRLPFVQKMAQERIEEQVHAAKAEIDSFIQLKRSAGLELGTGELKKLKE